jgi:hypothetical protein
MLKLCRYSGNPTPSGNGRPVFDQAGGDFYCGLRGFNKAEINNYCPKTTCPFPLKLGH